MCLGIESTAHTFGASLVDDHDRIVTNVNSTYRPPVGVGIHPRKASEHLASVADSIVKTALSTQDGSSRNGPVTQQDRWEEDGGYSPFTLAAEIAGLLAAADFAE